MGEDQPGSHTQHGRTKATYWGMSFYSKLFADSRAQLTKSCAAGLSARFLRVTIPFGRHADGSSTGRALNSAPWAGNLRAEAGRIVTNRPVARRLSRMWGESV